MVRSILDPQELHFLGQRIGTLRSDPEKNSTAAMDIYRAALEGARNLSFGDIYATLGDKDADLLRDAAEKQIVSRVRSFIKRDPEAPNPPGMTMHEFYVTTVFGAAEYYGIDMLGIYQKAAKEENTSPESVRFKVNNIILHSFRSSFNSERQRDSHAIEDYLQPYKDMRDRFNTLSHMKWPEAETAKLAAFGKEIEPLHAEMREQVLDELKRRRLTLANLRGTEKISALGFSLTRAAELFGEEDKRWSDLRDSMRSSPKIMNTLLQRICSTLKERDDRPDLIEFATSLYKRLYPETIAETTNDQILGMAFDKLQALHTGASLRK